MSSYSNCSKFWAHFVTFKKSFQITFPPSTALYLHTFLVLYFFVLIFVLCIFCYLRGLVKVKVLLLLKRKLVILHIRYDSKKAVVVISSCFFLCQELPPSNPLNSFVVSYSLYFKVYLDLAPFCIPHKLIKD